MVCSCKLLVSFLFHHILFSDKRMLINHISYIPKKKLSQIRSSCDKSNPSIDPDKFLLLPHKISSCLIVSIYSYIEIIVFNRKKSLRNSKIFFIDISIKEIRTNQITKTPYMRGIHAN